jgi:hypothetical protein
MSDLQTALNEVAPHLQFDDEPRSTGQSNPAPVGTRGITESVFDIIKANPSIAGGDVFREMRKRFPKVPQGTIASTLKALTERKIVGRLPSGITFRYFTAVEEYSSPTARDSAIKGHATRKIKGRAAKKAAKPGKVGRPPKAKAPMTGPADTPVTTRGPGRPSKLDGMIENLTMGELRTLKAKLDRIFGG